MNAIKYFFLTALIGLTIISCKSSANLADYSTEAIDAAILGQNYSFVPSTAIPTQMRSRNLSHSFHLDISPTEINSYLPYFGRAYQAPMNSSESGIQFVSKNFEYTIKEKKSKEYEITIITKDTPRRTKFRITTSSKGYTSVSVNEDNRQSISFNGRIEVKTKE